MITIGTVLGNEGFEDLTTALFSALDRLNYTKFGDDIDAVNACFTFQMCCYILKPECLTYPQAAALAAAASL